MALRDPKDREQDDDAVKKTYATLDEDRRVEDGESRSQDPEVGRSVEGLEVAIRNFALGHQLWIDE